MRGFIISLISVLVGVFQSFPSSQFFGVGICGKTSSKTFWTILLSSSASFCSKCSTKSSSSSMLIMLSFISYILSLVRERRGFEIKGDCCCIIRSREPKNICTCSYCWLIRGESCCRRKCTSIFSPVIRDRICCSY